MSVQDTAQANGEEAMSLREIPKHLDGMSTISKIALVVVTLAAVNLVIAAVAVELVKLVS